MANNVKHKLKIKNIIILLLFIGLIIVLFFSLKNIITWKVDEDATNKQIEEIVEEDTVQEVVEDNNENVEIIEQTEKPKPEDQYWDYIKYSLISVDFSELKEKNSDTVGWIQINGTNINYPFVQTNNNEYYLKHSFNKTSNSAGWVFLDYRNSSDLTNKNNIIYAHGRINNTMFGSLRTTLTNGWLNKKSNHVFKISTPSTNTMWQVFSVYKIKPVTDYLQIKFAEDDYEKFLDNIIKRSAYNFNTSVSKEDNILTLSTCYDNNNRMVLHAKLIKKETR